MEYDVLYLIPNLWKGMLNVSHPSLLLLTVSLLLLKLNQSFHLSTHINGRLTNPFKERDVVTNLINTLILPKLRNLINIGIRYAYPNCICLFNSVPLQSKTKSR